MEVYLLNAWPVQVRMWQSTDVLLEMICGYLASVDGLMEVVGAVDAWTFVFPGQ